MTRKHAKKRAGKPAAAKSSKGDVITGSGGYFGKLAGTALAKILGKDAKTQKAWAAKGDKLGDIASSVAHPVATVLGLGSYSLKKNSFATGAPFMHSQDPRARICHREFLGNVTGSTVFQLTSYDLNPGQANTFPWLSREAQNWEEYKFHGLCFTYRSLSATALNSVNTALGAVCMATQYNSLNPPFTTKIQMEDAQFGVSGKPAADLVHFVECARDANPLCEGYVRTGPVQGDQRVTDLGKFSIATVGMQASAEIGELWVSYDVEFIKPKLLFEGAQLAQADHWAWYGNVKFAAQDYIGDNLTVVSSAIGGSLPNAYTYNFPPTANSRYYLVVYNYENLSDATIPTMPDIGFTNCVGWLNLCTAPGATPRNQTAKDAPGTTGICANKDPLGTKSGGCIVALVHVTSGSASITFSGGNNGGQATAAGDLIVAAYGGPGFGVEPLKPRLTDAELEAALLAELRDSFGMRLDEFSNFHKFFLDYRTVEGFAPDIKICVEWLAEQRVDNTRGPNGRSRRDELNSVILAAFNKPTAFRCGLTPHSRAVFDDCSDQQLMDWLEFLMHRLTVEDYFEVSDGGDGRRKPRDRPHFSRE